MCTSNKSLMVFKYCTHIQLYLKSLNFPINQMHHTQSSIFITCTVLARLDVSCTMFAIFFVSLCSCYLSSQRCMLIFSWRKSEVDHFLQSKVLGSVLFFDINFSEYYKSFYNYFQHELQSKVTVKYILNTNEELFGGQ